jgi:hypothetical protein
MREHLRGIDDAWRASKKAAMAVELKIVHCVDFVDHVGGAEKASSIRDALAFVLPQTRF